MCLENRAHVAHVARECACLEHRRDGMSGCRNWSAIDVMDNSYVIRIKHSYKSRMVRKVVQW